jgi:NAD(P)-dependent dehydrogenase (short-subunit alcohol dehydrogenase family)
MLSTDVLTERCLDCVGIHAFHVARPVKAKNGLNTQNRFLPLTRDFGAMQTMQIQGLSAIVTGGASGLGAATAQRLAGLGAKVALFDLECDAGRALANTLGAMFQRVDVTKEGDVEQGLDAAESAHGPARVLVNCAGIAPAIKTVGREFVPHPLDRFRQVIEINLVGTFIVLSRFAARLARQKPIEEERGVIINTASIAAFEGQIGHAAYSASKAGIVGLTLPIARELASSQIRVMTIAPGIFSTPLVAGLSSRVQESVASQIRHPNRMGYPDEFAQLVESIILNPMLNGETIRIDGAVRLPPR